SAGPVVRVDFGRDEDASTDLTGLGNVGTSIEVGAFVAYVGGPARYRLRVVQDIAGGHEGAQAMADVSLAVFRSSTLVTAANLSTSFGFNKYLDAYYTINATKSAASGLPVYDAGSG